MTNKMKTSDFILELVDKARNDLMEHDRKRVILQVRLDTLKEAVATVEKIVSKNEAPKQKYRDYKALGGRKTERTYKDIAMEILSINPHVWYSISTIAKAAIARGYFDTSILPEYLVIGGFRSALMKMNILERKADKGTVDPWKNRTIWYFKLRGPIP